MNTIKFNERMKFVLDDRKPTPWGKALGFTSSTLSCMFKDNVIPGQRFLTTIYEAENVNINWLLTGKGAKFVVHHLGSAKALNEEIDNLLKSGMWQLYICSHGNSANIIARSKMQDGHSIDCIKLIHGSGSDKLTKTLLAHSNRDDLLVPFIDIDTNTKFIEGELGSYALMHSEKGILRKSRTARDSDLQFTPEIENGISFHTKAMNTIISEVEKYCQTETNSSQFKDKVIDVVYRKTAHLDLPDEELARQVQTAFALLCD